MTRELRILVVCAASVAACDSPQFTPSSTNGVDAAAFDGGVGDSGRDAVVINDGSSDAGTCADAALAPEITQACARHFERLRAKFEACARFELPAARVADLKVAFQARCEELAGYPGSGFGATWMDRCASAIESAACDALRSLWSLDISPIVGNVVPIGWTNHWPAGCERPLGTRQPGAPCAVGAQCDTGACSGAMGCGVCLSVHHEGDGCGPASECEDGTACDPATNQCRRFPSTPGERCLHATCGFGLSCGIYTAPQVCSLLKGEGAPCSYDYDCSGDLQCAGTCKRGTIALGGACGEELCATGLFCNGGVCAPPSFAPSDAGAPCAAPSFAAPASALGVLCADGACACTARNDDGWCHRTECAPDWATGCAHNRDCSRSRICCD